MAPTQTNDSAKLPEAQKSQGELCQQCKRTITAVARAEKTRLRVLDITELVWQAVENGMTQT